MSTRVSAINGVSALGVALILLGLFAFTRRINPVTSEIVLWLIGVVLFVISSWAFVGTAQFAQQLSMLLIPVGLALYITGIYLMYQD